MKLDEIDLNILEILQNNSHQNLEEISAKVNLSPSACHNRIKKLEKEKIITGYTASVNMVKIAKITEVFVTVRLGKHRVEIFRKFEDEILSYPQITECYAIGGGLDYLLKFAVANINDYQFLIEKLLHKSLEITEYYTYIVTGTTKKGCINIRSLI